MHTYWRFEIPDKRVPCAIGGGVGRCKRADTSLKQYSFSSMRARISPDACFAQCQQNPHCTALRFPCLTSSLADGDSRLANQMPRQSLPSNAGAIEGFGGMRAAVGRYGVGSTEKQCCRSLGDHIRGCYAGRSCCAALSG